MAHSYSALYVHLVFATKNRQPFLADRKLREELHAYIGGTCKGLKCPTYIVGGVEDHVHIIAGQARTISVADCVLALKKATNGFMQEKGQYSFGWQDGYGAFSFTKHEIPRLVQYVASQEEHHRKQTFKEEYIELLELAGIEYDERYLWE